MANDIMDHNAGTKTTSPWRAGADSGLIAGIYFSAIFMTWVASPLMPWLSVITVAMVASFPFIVYKTLRGRLTICGQRCEITELWIQGISMITCGAVICAAVALVYLRWINPSFMVETLQRAVDTYQATNDPSLESMATMAGAILENRAVPSAATLVVTIWLFTVTSGAMMAGLMAILAKLRGPGKHRIIRP